MEENTRSGPVTSASVVRFGPYELDLRSAELRKNDLRIRLQDQPFQILVALLKHPGDVVLREEIRQRLRAFLSLPPDNASDGPRRPTIRASMTTISYSMLTWRRSARLRLRRVNRARKVVFIDSTDQHGVELQFTYLILPAQAAAILVTTS